MNRSSIMVPELVLKRNPKRLCRFKIQLLKHHLYLLFHVTYSGEKETKHGSYNVALINDSTVSFSKGKDRDSAVGKWRRQLLLRRQFDSKLL
jgi:hypothetical protein